MKETWGSPTLGRPHIALAMISKGYVSSIKEAFNKYLGDDKPCCVSGGYFSVEETIQNIHEGNGFALIAHPHLIKNDLLVSQLLSMPFDGLEAYYGRFAMNQQEKWVKLAQRRIGSFQADRIFMEVSEPEQSLGSSWVDNRPFKS